jgi:AcrR family transcriptional regulator
MASPKGEDKRQRIVEAAVALFNRYGYKRTSIELLAAEAGVAKPTIYAYFEDKDAIFRAVVEAVCDELLERAEAASGGRGSIEERLTAMLAAKLTRYFELVQASPHAQELVDSQGRLGAEIVQRTDRAYVKLLVAALEAEPELHPSRIGMSAASAAQLLLRAASGAAYDATTPAAHRKRLGEIVRAIVASMRG